MSPASKEIEHWDAVAAETAKIDAELLHVGPDDLYDRSKAWLPYLDFPMFVERLLGWLGDLNGKHVLDLGTGTGYLACALAHRGAHVHGIDVSPRSIEICKERARISGVAGSTSFSVMSSDRLEFPDRHFDAVAGLLVLHHTDLEKTVAELSRVLKSGGHGAFLETIGLNPLLMAARRHLVGRRGIEKASSEDEAPLDDKALQIIRERFQGSVDLIFPSVVFLRMLNYVVAFQRAPLQRAFLLGDRVLESIPLMRRLGYFGLVQLVRN